jgi:autotransporter-associated beta strand protein
MSKSRKSLTILASAVVPVLYGANLMAQSTVTVVQYPDGNPPTLPGFWPSSIQNNNQGPSATGTDPVILANGAGNTNVNGAPANGGPGVVSGGVVTNPAGSALVNEIISQGGKLALIAETFKTTSAFKLGGVSFDMVGGADSGFSPNGASIHLYQFNPGTVTGTSTQYNLSTQSTGVDLLGGGQGAVWTPAAISNIGQFVFSGTDQVNMQANTEYVFEIFVDTVDSGDSLGVMRCSGSDNMPSPVPYADGALFGLSPSTSGVSQQSYSANFSISRIAGVFAGATRGGPFAIYPAAPTLTTGTWTGAATTGSNSDWNNSGNWSAGVIPGGTPGDNALFGTGASSVNVSLNGTQTLGRLTFNGPSYTIAQGSGGSLQIEGTTVNATAHIDDLFGNSTVTAPVALLSPTQITVGQATNTLTFSGNISGAGSVTLTGDSTIAVQVGTVLFSGTNTYGGGTTVNGGGLIIGSAGSLPTNNAVTVTSGTMQLGASIGGVQLSSLSIGANGTLDINNNHVIINYGASDPVSSIAALLNTGFNGGAWNGLGGITSSAIASNPGYSVGYADSADTGNPAGLASGTLEIAFTLIGDADLNHTVNGIDFGILAANFNKTVSRWDQGDFDYNGIVNGLDFTNLASNFNKAANNASDIAALDAFAAANGLLADVPEPATVGLLGVAGVSLLARRRQTRRRA